MKSNRKMHSFSLILSALVTFILVSVLLFSIVQAQEKIVLQYGHLMATTHNLQIVGEWMQKELAERTNDLVELKIYPNAVLGNETEMVEGCRIGTLDMTPTGGPLGAWVEKMRVVDMPYVFDSYEHFKRCFVDPGPVGKELAGEILKEADLRVLGWFAQGFRITTCRTKPIMKLEDFKGVKIRTHENPLVVATFRALGAEAIPMAFGEVYTSLKTGVIDAMESPASTIGAMRFCEVAPYISHTDHFFLLTALVIGEKKFNSLPADIKKVVLDVGKESQYVMLDALEENIQLGLSQMRALETLETWPDLEPFREAVKPVVKEYGEKYGVTDLLEVIESLR